MVTVLDMGAARHFLRTGEIKDMEHLVYFKPHVHVNLTHPLIKSLYKMRKTDKETATILAEQVGSHKHMRICKRVLIDESIDSHVFRSMITL